MLAVKVLRSYIFSQENKKKIYFVFISLFQFSTESGKRNNLKMLTNDYLNYTGKTVRGIYSFHICGAFKYVNDRHHRW